MERHNGLDYAQNYDVITKWLADALRGETLDVLGVRSGRIQEVFGFEPAEIAVTVDRVDVMLRDDAGNVFHLEEQRNLRQDDLYRCASYHFQAARQWGPGVTDLILASGDVMAGLKVLETSSGTYTPRIIDFTERDGEQRLHEIRAAVAAGTFTQWVELVFLPLYGKVTGAARSALVEQVVRFEKELYQADKISNRLLAATLIMSNKLIAKTRLYALWEEVKMLDILEIAREKGVEEGKTLMLDALWDMILDTLLEYFPVVPASIAEPLRRIQNVDVLKGLHRQAIRCRDLHEFETLLHQVG